MKNLLNLHEIAEHITSAHPRVLYNFLSVKSVKRCKFCECSDRATEKKGLGGNFKHSGCGSVLQNSVESNFMWIQEVFSANIVTLWWTMSGKTR